MDSQFKTSFIPKKPIETSIDLSAAPRTPNKVGRTIFSIVGTFVFVGTLAAYGATFAWQIKLNAEIKSQLASLQKTKEEFDERFIQDASRLNTRIQQGSQILDNHVSPSSLYSLLEEYTLQTVSFGNFSFFDNQDGTLTIGGSGDAARYESIVLQSDAFGRSGFLRNVIFTDLRPATDNSTVGFTFEATLDPRLILYRNSLPVVTNEQQ
jgi:hypothetical protein